MRKCCFTAVADQHFYPEGAVTMIHSFRKFHPDIDLIVFKQNTIDKLFKEKNIDWYCAKPFFAELLFNDYDLIVNMDADHAVCGRLTEIFDNTDYDVGGPWNWNDYENASFENITPQMYIQGGIVASTSKEFWLKWQSMNRDAHKYVRRENDILNLLVYNEMPNLKLKIFDRHKDYYGCKSLNREREFYIQNDSVWCRGEKVLAYHWAKGQAFPKMKFELLPFKPEVRNWLDGLSLIPCLPSYKLSSI